MILQFFLQGSCKVFISYKKSFSARHVQDLVQDLASLVRKILARLEYFLQDGFYWDVTRAENDEHFDIAS